MGCRVAASALGNGAHLGPSTVDGIVTRYYLDAGAPEHGDGSLAWLGGVMGSWCLAWALDGMGLGGGDCGG